MKALVHDLDFSLGSHGEKVSSYFLNDAPSGWSVVEFEDPATGFFPSPDNVSGAIDKAISKSCKIVIRSYSNVWDFKEEWDRAWDNGILVVHAHGSNSNVDLTTPPELRPSVMAVGGESPAGSYEDERSYGDGLELDAIAHDGSTAESWATPTVAAQQQRGRAQPRAGLRPRGLAQLRAGRSRRGRRPGLRLYGRRTVGPPAHHRRF